MTSAAPRRLSLAAPLLRRVALVAPLLLLAMPVLAQSDDAADPEPAARKTTRSSRARAKPAAKPEAKTGKADAKGAAAASKAAASGPGGGQATLVATFSDWSAYTAQTGKAKICYALSLPKARQPANLKNTPAYLFVSFRPADNVKNEVAAVMGFPMKDGGSAEVAAGSTSYALVTKGANAWVKNPAEEPQVIATMSKGQTVTVSATSARGNKTSDKYSLTGFGPALDRARKECPGS